ncbi:MAG: ThuA domain-containing protein [Roseburia sp.]
MQMIRVTIYNEFVHEKEYEEVKKVYPQGIHTCIANFLKEDSDIMVRTATFEEKEHGLSEEVLSDTDVLIFWSHARQDEFSDEVALRVKKHVLRGMGLVALHSAHYSKVMKVLLGTSMTLKWHHGETERLWCVNPTHPIAEGVPEVIELPMEEMYGEYFDIPKPDDVVFAGWFSGGNVFRSGCTFTRGYGKIFYFQPGHEEYPIYYDKNIQKIIKNAVRFVNPVVRKESDLECVGQ